MILKIFSPKKTGENIGVFLLKLLLVFGFWEKRNNFRQKLAKSHKIVIITSNPGKNYSIKTLLKMSGTTAGTDVLIFKIFSPKNSAKKLAFLSQNKAKFWKKLTITLFFEKNANFFHRKLSKIAENCDHNIDPWFVKGLNVNFSSPINFFTSSQSYDFWIYSYNASVVVG
jgi:hypothetical protein